MKGALRERSLRALSHPRFSLYCVIAAVVLALPTLVSGFYCDDWAFIARMGGKVPGPHGVFELYRFTAAAPADLYAMGVPWWAAPDLRLNFFRPIASALLHLDYVLFGLAPFGYHLHAILWFAALAVVVGLLLRRALPEGTGAFALLLFVLDDAHIQPVGWIACRHALVAAVPALLGLIAHLRAREEGWVRGRVLAVLGIGLGLLVSEVALGVPAYLFAYELIGRRADSRGTRLKAALPTIALCAAYLVYYKVSGHGTAHNDFYLEPFANPLGFAIAAAHRLPILIGDLFAGIPADLANVVDPRPMVVIGIIAAVAVGALAWALRSRMTERERVSLSWLSLGALGALVAATGGYPGSRLLLLPSIGGAAVVAVLVRRGLLEATRPESRAIRFGCGALVFINLVLAPVSFTLNGLALAQMAAGSVEAARTAEIAPPLPRDVFVLAGSDPLASLYPGTVIASTKEGTISHWNVLSMSRHAHRVTRTGPKSVAIEVTEGSFFDGGFVAVFRSVSSPFAVGDKIDLRNAGAVVEVTAVKDGAPTRIEVLLDRSIDDPHIVWLAWVDGRLCSIDLPPIGTSRDLLWSLGPTGIF